MAEKRQPLFIEAVCPAYHISGPLPHLLIYPPNVFPDYPDPEDCDPYKEEEDGEEGKNPLHLGADDETANEEEYGEGQGEKGGDDPEECEHL